MDHEKPNSPIHKLARLLARRQARIDAQQPEPSTAEEPDPFMEFIEALARRRARLDARAGAPSILDDEPLVAARKRGRKKAESEA